MPSTQYEKGRPIPKDEAAFNLRGRIVMSMAGTFTCANCGGTFDKEWTDEEATAEAERRFGGTPDRDWAVVCDTCYRYMLTWERYRDEKILELDRLILDHSDRGDGRCQKCRCAYPCPGSVVRVPVEPVNLTRGGFMLGR